MGFNDAFKNIEKYRGSFFNTDTPLRHNLLTLRQPILVLPY